MEEITLSIDCYQCGTKLEFLFRLFIGHADYQYCQKCQEGIEIFLNRDSTLQISRLEQE